jgi:hypothetical protein
MILQCEFSSVKEIVNKLSFAMNFGEGFDFGRFDFLAPTL